MQTKCRFCKSENFIKHGRRYNKKGLTQVYFCKSCKKYFTPRDGFFKMKYDKKVISAVLDLYNKKVCLRDISDHLKQFYSVDVSHVTVLRWIRRYGSLMKEFTDKLKPKTSKEWYVDETCLYFKGRLNWYWDIIDSETRFLVNYKLSMLRSQENANRLFSEARCKTKRRPKIISTDGLQNYPQAISRSFPSAEHNRCHTASLKAHMQKVEVYHATLKGFYKTRRGFSSLKSARRVLDCWFVYYNFLRYHSAIGMTPAEKANIHLDLNGNRWLNLINLAAGDRNA